MAREIGAKDSNKNPNCPQKCFLSRGDLPPYETSPRPPGQCRRLLCGIGATAGIKGISILLHRTRTPTPTQTHTTTLGAIHAEARATILPGPVKGRPGRILETTIPTVTGCSRIIPRLAGGAVVRGRGSLGEAGEEGAELRVGGRVCGLGTTGVIPSGIHHRGLQTVKGLYEEEAFLRTEKTRRQPHRLRELRRRAVDRMRSVGAMAVALAAAAEQMTLTIITHITVASVNRQLMDEGVTAQGTYPRTCRMTLIRRGDRTPP